MWPTLPAGSMLGPRKWIPAYRVINRHSDTSVSNILGSPTRHNTMHLRQLPLSLAISALFVLPARAQSLVDLYDAARAFDATYQSAKSQYDAGLAKAEQARAGLLPSVNLGMGANRYNI